MRKQPTERIVFSAEEIEIVQNDSEMNLFQKFIFLKIKPVLISSFY
jgi:hypothetical protein